MSVCIRCHWSDVGCFARNKICPTYLRLLKCPNFWRPKGSGPWLRNVDPTIGIVVAGSWGRHPVYPARGHVASHGVLMTWTGQRTGSRQREGQQPGEGFVIPDGSGSQRPAEAAGKVGLETATPRDAGSEAKMHELRGLEEALEAVRELEQEAASLGQEGPAEHEPGDGSEDSYRWGSGPCATGMTGQEKTSGAQSACGP